MGTMQSQSEQSSAGGGGASKALALLGAAGLGAAAMYFLDPERGARRRSLVRDRAVHAGHVAGDALGTTGRDLGNRARGLAATTRSRVQADAPTDEQLVGRVRAELGRVVSHPRAITVAAEQGRVTLAGPELAREAPALVERVRKLRGVSDVENLLELHETAGDVPALQGGEQRTGGRSELGQQSWTPAARLVAGVAGGALALAGSRRSGRVGNAIGVAGLTLLARSVTNTELRQILAAGRKEIDVQKTVAINAPAGEVFGFFTDWENWPKFMSHVRSVTASGARGAVGERTHWVVDGPAGTTVEWDAETTQFVPNETIAWRSVEGSAVQHAGALQFVSLADGTTRVHVQMSYTPPAGAVGHTVAKIFGRDPRTQMNDDLARLKTTIETRRPPRDAAEAGGQAVL
jgi:uncharacterized membrane protein